MQLVILTLLCASVAVVAGQAASCDDLQCPAGKACSMVRGKAYCLTERKCTDLRCRYDQECQVRRGIPRCVKVADCAKVTCEEGQECRVLGDVARCIKRVTCADLQCGQGEVCASVDGSASCQATQPCHDVPCPHDSECRVVLGEHRCVLKPTSCEQVYCDSGHVCRPFGGVPRCVTRTTCADTKCRYDHRCKVDDGLASCVPIPGTPCGDTSCKPGFKCLQNDGAPRCATELSCDGVQCSQGQACEIGRRGLPSCVPSCGSISCPPQAHCEIQLDYAVCVECDLKCPRGQVCKLVDSKLVSSLFVAKKKFERCVQI